MEKLINQLSDEQLMMLLSLVEDHQISRAIDYLRKYTQFRLDQAKAIVIYCVEQRQRALYHYKKNPSYIPKLTITRHVSLEEEYQFDDDFLEDLEFSSTYGSGSKPAHLLQQAKSDNTKTFLMLWCVAFIISMILLMAVGLQYF